MRGFSAVFLFSTSLLLAQQAGAFSASGSSNIAFLSPLHLFEFMQEASAMFPSPAKTQYPPTKTKTENIKRIAEKKAYDLSQPMARRQKNARYMPRTISLASQEGVNIEVEIDSNKFSEMDYKEREDFARQILKKHGLLGQYFKLNHKNKRGYNIDKKPVTNENTLASDDLSQSSEEGLLSLEEHEYSHDPSSGEEEDFEYDNNSYEEDCDESIYDDEEENWDPKDDNQEFPKTAEKNWLNDHVQENNYDWAFEAEDRFLGKFDLRNQKRSNSKEQRKTKAATVRKAKEQEIYLALEQAGWIFVHPQN